MIELRAGSPTDAGKVGAILTEFAETTAWMPCLHTGAQDIAHAGELIDRGWVMVAEKDADVVGFAASDGQDLIALYVSAVARGQGVGGALIGWLQTRKPRLELWTFEANTRAQGFYVRHGFKEVSRTDGAGNDEKLPDIKFAWQQEQPK